MEIATTCTHCSNEITTAVYAREFCSEFCRLQHVEALTLCLADQVRGTEKYRFLVHKLIGMWTLSEYIAWLNQPDPDPMVLTFPLVTDLDHWASYGIHTANQLGEYLDGCCERERQKSSMAWQDEYAKPLRAV